MLLLQGGSEEAADITGQGDGFDKEQQKQVDNRSIYVGNVDYSVDSKAIAEFFSVHALPAWLHGVVRFSVSLMPCTQC